MLNDNRITYIKDLIKTSDEAFFVYFLKDLKDSTTYFYQNINEDNILYYALKANSHPAIITFLDQNFKNIRFDVASLNELQLLIDLNILPNKISFTGPGKSLNEIATALSYKIDQIVVESAEELERVINLNAGQTKILLRVNLKESNNQFGISKEEIIDLLIRYKNNQQIYGFHFHQKSQILKETYLIAQYEKILQTVDEIILKTNFNCRILNFGSGIGIPYFENDKEMDLKSLSFYREKLLTNFAKNHNCQIQFESGRYLIGKSGYYLCKVEYTKEINSIKYLITNGGMHHFMAACGFGQILKKNYRISSISSDQKINLKHYTIAGKTCSELDILGDNVELPETKSNDWICIENAGAYGQSYSPSNFILLNKAKELIVTEDI